MRRRVAALAAVGLGTGLLVLVPGLAEAAPGTVVISQVYGGGGNLGAPLTHDYVELFNRSAASVDLSTYSVQYASATGTGAFAANVAPLSGTLAPGRYFLLELAAGATPAAELPTPDATGSLNLSGTAGKVALVSSTTGLACNGSSTACSDEQKALIADLVGFGTANFFEGAGAAPATGNTTALVRAGNGCTDTDVNSADFTAVAPAPRNGATTAAPCGGVDPEPTPTPTPTHDTCDTPVTQQIADIQGAGTASPLAGQTVRFEGIVTADHQGPDQLSGFFVQDDTPDADATTSDAVFVYSTLPAAVGDRVRVTGKVAEFGGATELTGVTDVNVCGTGTIAATVLDLPLKAGVTRERYEGTLVRLPEALTVSELYDLSRYGEVLLAAGGSRLWNPTERGDTTLAKNAERSLVLDDGSAKQNPAVTPYLPLRIGDKVNGLTGVLHEGFGSYRIEPTKAPVWQHANPRRAAPGSVGGAANVRVASFNTLNWFQTINDAAHPDARGADSVSEQQRQLAKEIETLAGLDADIVGLMEVENNGDAGALKVLVDALNAKVGAGTYKWIDHPSPGTDAIHVAMIYRAAKVTPVGAATTIDSALFERHPLVQRFERVGGSKPVTLIVNHWKSKGCGVATGPDLDLGQGCWNARRTAQAEAISALADTVDNPLVIGDLNSYSDEDPIHVLENGGLISQSEKYEPKSKRYSYVFDGMSGELDHVMAGAALKVTGLSIWHINADESPALDYNQEFNPPYLYQPDEFRSSDHDPVVVGLKLKK